MNVARAMQAHGEWLPLASCLDDGLAMADAARLKRKKRAADSALKHE